MLQLRALMRTLDTYISHVVKMFQVKATHFLLKLFMHIQKCFDLYRNILEVIDAFQTLTLFENVYIIGTVSECLQTPPV